MIRKITSPIRPPPFFPVLYMDSSHLSRNGEIKKPTMEKPKRKNSRIDKVRPWGFAINSDLYKTSSSKALSINKHVGSMMYFRLFFFFNIGAQRRN